MLDHEGAFMKNSSLWKIGKTFWRKKQETGQNWSAQQVKKQEGALGCGLTMGSAQFSEVAWEGRLLGSAGLDEEVEGAWSTLQDEHSSSPDAQEAVKAGGRGR